MKKTLLPGALALLVLLATFVSLTFTQDLPDGLKIETTRPVACVRKSQRGDLLTVHYKGTLLDGFEFDSSYGRGTPFQFTLGVGEVIKGWDKGMAGMCPGEARKLTVPAKMGYGSRMMGNIPPDSVLIFYTELLAIAGVEKETAPPPPPPSTANEKPDATPSSQETSEPAKTPEHSDAKLHPAGADGAIVAEGPESGPAKHKDNQGECKLLGRFAILVQGSLGLLAFLALVWKRWREKNRRPVKVWFFDVSKQVVGSFLMHFANLFLSILSSGGLELQVAPTEIAPLVTRDADRRHPNPCSFYLLNLAIDTTIGIAILVFFLRIFHALLARTPLANPPESLKSGNYGHPPNWRWWIKQAFVYFLGLFAMKFCVFLMFQFFPWLGWVGDWALRWTEGKEWVQIVFVMLIFPLIMNVAQYWIIDSFIKDPAGAYDYDQINHEEDDDGVNETLIGRGRGDDDDGTGHIRHISPNSGRVVAVGGESRTKEANPLPLPIEFDSDEEEQGHRHARRLS